MRCVVVLPHSLVSNCGLTAIEPLFMAVPRFVYRHRNRLVDGGRDPIATSVEAMCAAQSRRAVVLVALPRSQPPDNPGEAAAHDAPVGERPR